MSAVDNFGLANSNNKPKQLTPVDSAWSFSNANSVAELETVHNDVILPISEPEPVPESVSIAVEQISKIDPQAIISADKNSAEFQNIMKEASQRDSDLFQAATLGDSARVYYLLENDLAKVTDRDEQNCTALHWAAINNQVYVAKTLTLFGAEVLAEGGDRKMTALQWASHAGQTAMVMLLLDACPNPYEALHDTDSGGCNCMHLAVQSGHDVLVLYLLGRGMDVDVADTEGRTPLMWACYVGNSKDILPLLLRWNADVNATDRSGFTALHWSVVSRHYQFAAKLIREGAHYDSLDFDGKSAEEWADEKCTRELWDIYCVPEIKLVEEETSRLPRRYKRPVYAMLFGGEAVSPDISLRRGAASKQRQHWNKLGLSQMQTERLLYVLPFAVIPCAMAMFSLLSVWLALVIVPVFIYVGGAFVAYPLLRPSRDFQLREAEKKRVQFETKSRGDESEGTCFVDKNSVSFLEPPYGLLDTSPFLAAVFQASCFWIFATWVFKMAAYLPMGGFANAVFVVSMCLTMLLYYKACLSNPGTIARPKGNLRSETRDQVRATVLQLAHAGRLHSRYYCSTCEIERPLRSKHCRITGRCIHRFDHYCPWAYNAIGARNHKSFVLFLYFGLIAANLFISLGFNYLTSMSQLLSSSTVDACPAFTPLRYICSLYVADSWVFIAVVYTFFQSNWMSLLTIFQTVGIVQDRTTNETMNASKYEYLDEMASVTPAANCKRFWFTREVVPSVTPALPLDLLTERARDSADLAFTVQPDDSNAGALPGDYDDDNFVPGDMASTMKKANSLAFSVLTHPKNPLRRFFTKNEYSKL